MKRGLLVCFVILLFLFGFGLLFFPDISNFLAEQNSTKILQGYDGEIKAMNAQSMWNELQKAAEYNTSLATFHESSFFMPVTEEALPEEYLSALNFKGIMAYIHIPKADITLPIYHGTSEEVLQKGVGHMENTSLPVGGSGNHTALTGHRGLLSAKLFSSLDKLKIGDVFYIHVLDQTLTYAVDLISVVEPDATELLRPVKGYDYASLVTCTPYGVNSHRLIIRGVRVPYGAEQQEQRQKAPITGNSAQELRIYIIFAGFSGMAAVLLLVIFSGKLKQSLNKKKMIFQTAAMALFIAGSYMMLYSPVSSYIYAAHSERVIDDYTSRMENIAAIRLPMADSSWENSVGGNGSLSDVFYQLMVRYNEDLFEEKQSKLVPSLSNQQPDEKIAEFGFNEDMMGYIDIPKIDIRLPIYLGANEENLAKGAAHITKTSLPVGGMNTNAVIAAHRGFRGTAMFRDIEKLEKGDEIIIVNFHETLVYRVAEIKIIDPTDMEAILIQPERDMITLLTCHPYGKNEKRYLVYCDRVIQHD